MRKARFKRWLQARFSLRLHMFILLLLVCLAGLLLSRLLLVAGLTSMPVRYGVVVVLSYGAFLGLVRLWLYYFVESARPSTGDAEDAVDVMDVDLGGAPASGGSLGSGSGGGGSVDLGDGEGAVIVIVVALVAAVLLAAGLFVIWQAPLILSEAAFQVALAAGLGRSARRLDTEHWAASILRATWWSLLLVLVLAVVGGWIVQHFCPAAATVGQALRECT